MASVPVVFDILYHLPSVTPEELTPKTNAAKRTVLLKQAERAQRIEEKANAKVAEEEAKAE